ncbi:MAG: SRPBCC domain-containing protein [Acidimicrobiia bacterium]|nr:SRPBCC domain-containing protein [Acidimicrobiia bacterium]
MTVTTVTKNLEQATMTIVAEYSASPARVWQLWADPRQLERWWGPPTHPATVTEHDLAPEGIVRYYMTGPDGERYHGGWRMISVEEPSRLEFEDFFADDEGGENPDLPRTRTVVSIDEQGSGETRMTIASFFPSPEAMAQVLEMGMEEGITQALSQTDAILAEHHS